MRTIHDHHLGRPVTNIRTVRAIDVDFPGWGQPGQYDHFVDHAAGAHGIITCVESHGAAPFTRYSIRWADNSTSVGIEAWRLSFA